MTSFCRSPTTTKKLRFFSCKALALSLGDPRWAHANLCAIADQRRYASVTAVLLASIATVAPCMHSYIAFFTIATTPQASPPPTVNA
jgi:hypothetical protein